MRADARGLGPLFAESAAARASRPIRTTGGEPPVRNASFFIGPGARGNKGRDEEDFSLERELGQAAEAGRDPKARDAPGAVKDMEPPPAPASRAGGEVRSEAGGGRPLERSRDDLPDNKAGGVKGADPPSELQAPAVEVPVGGVPWDRSRRPAEHGERLPPGGAVRTEEPAEPSGPGAERRPSRLRKGPDQEAVERVGAPLVGADGAAEVH